MGNIDHKKGEIGGIGHSGLGGIHEIFETPELLSISKVKFNLESQTVI
jgi:hypothetical protein